MLRGCHKRLRELNGAMSRLIAAGTTAGQDSRAAGQAVWRASPPLVAAIRHQMAGDTKSADQHWKLTGSPLARFLMITGRPQTCLGFWFFTIPRISVLEYK